jgi:hypothetical protein
MGLMTARWANKATGRMCTRCSVACRCGAYVRRTPLCHRLDENETLLVTDLTELRQRVVEESTNADGSS